MVKLLGITRANSSKKNFELKLQCALWNFISMMFEGELDEENNPDYKIKVSDWKECGAD